jgi:MSHA pilin protein MshD
MFTRSMTRRYRYSQSGISLIELIMFMVIVGVGLAGILSVMNVTTKASADPMLRKQAAAIAESMLEEIALQPFTYCDPDDANAATATGAFAGPTGCDATVEVLGQEPLAGIPETRYAEPFFDNVSDYHGFSMPAGIVDITNAPIAGLGAYTAGVTITPVGTALFGLAPANNGDALQIDVRVQSGANVDVTLTGYRFRYAPTITP